MGEGEFARLVRVVDYGRGYFELLGMRPSVGALPRPETYGQRVAVLSYRAWQQDFGGRADILGRAITVGEQAFTVVAVASGGFQGTDIRGADVWLPLDVRAPVRFGADWESQPFSFNQKIIARTGPDASRANLSGLATRTYHETNSASWARQVRVLAGDVRELRGPGGSPAVDVALWSAAVSTIVLVLGLIDSGGLIIARGVGNRSELALRAFLGASRWRLFRNLALEGVLLGLGAAAIAFAASSWTASLEALVIGPDAGATEPSLDLRSVGLITALSVACTALLSVLPAWRLSRCGSLAAPSNSRLGSLKFYDVFIWAQSALTTPLAIGAVLFWLSLGRVVQQPMGLDPTNVIVVSSAASGPRTSPDGSSPFRRLCDALQRLPWVESGAVVGLVPLRSLVGFSVKASAAGAQLSEGPYANTVDPAYLDVLRIKVLQGRSFNNSDNQPGARMVALVNQSMSRALWPGTGGLHRCVYLRSVPNECIDVVGIVADAWVLPGRASVPAFLLPTERFKNLIAPSAVLIRTRVDIPDGLELARHESFRSTPELGYVEVSRIEDALVPMRRPQKTGASLFGLFACMALAISSAGLAGASSYAARSRRRDIGIRKALGAGRRALFASVLTGRVVAVLSGITAGLVATLLAARGLAALLFGISAFDGRVYGSVAVCLAAAALAALWLPAARIVSKIDPSDLLRTE